MAMVTPHERGAMRRTTRILAGTAAFASAALVLAGCSGGGSNSSGEYDPDEEVTLEMSWWGDDNRAALFAEVIDMFEAEYPNIRSEEHTSELQSLMRISYAVFCLKTKKQNRYTTHAEYKLIVSYHYDDL